MPQLSIKDLHLIPSTPLTLELAKGGRLMSDADAEDLLSTAHHEAAHYVAALACKSYVWQIVARASRRAGGSRGQVWDAAPLPVHDAFISFAGYAWERRHGQAYRAEQDLERGCESACEAGVDAVQLFRRAEEFVELDAEDAIRYATVGILALSTKQGVLAGKRLQALNAWLKSHVPALPHFPLRGSAHVGVPATCPCPAPKT